VAVAFSAWVGDGDSLYQIVKSNALGSGFMKFGVRRWLCPQGLQVRSLKHHSCFSILDGEAQAFRKEDRRWRGIFSKEVCLGMRTFRAT
jgi:hypothetical protein